MDGKKNRKDLEELQEQVDSINCNIDLMRMEFNDSIATFLRSYSNDDSNKKVNNSFNGTKSRIQSPTQQHIQTLYEDNRKLEEDLNELQVLQRSIETFIEEKQKQIDEEKIRNEKKRRTTRRDICAEDKPQCAVPNCELENQYELLLRESLPSSSSCSFSSSNSNSEDEEEVKIKVKNTSSSISSSSISSSSTTSRNRIEICSETGMCPRVSSPIQNQPPFNQTFAESIPPLEEELNDQTVFQDESTSHFYQKIGYIRTLLMMKKEISSRLVVDNCGCINIFEETSNTLEIQQEDEVRLDFSNM